MTTSSGEHDGKRPRFEYVTRGRRVLIAYIDSALASGAYALLYGLPFVHRTVVVDLVTGVLALALTVALVVRLGGTPAKLLLAARVVDARGELLTIRRALLREIPSIATMLVGLWVLQDVLAGLPRGSTPPSSAELGEAYRASGRLWAVNLVNWCRLVDVAVVLFNPARRAIHDYLAGSYVITKRSFLAVRGLGPPVDVESLPPASLPVRAFASLLIVFCAAELAKIAFFDLLPLLWSNDLRGGGLGSEHAIAVFVLVSFFVQTFVTLLAGIALVSNRTWARAWVICISAAAVAPIVMTLAAGGRPESWDGFATNLDRPILAIIHGLPIAHLALAILALVLFLAYDRWRPDAPAIRGREWAAALVGVLALFGVQRGLSFDVRHAWDEHRIAATTVEDGTGTAIVTLTYGGKPLEEPDGTPVYVTLQDLKTSGRTRVSGQLAHGTVKLEALKTGIYSVGAVVDADRRNGLARNRPMAGDYEGIDGRFHLVRNGEVATGALPVQRMLRLLRPEDTEMGLPPLEGCVRMKAPVEFEWDPVPLATGYRCFVTRRWREGEQWSSGYAKSSYGPATTCRFDLPTSAPGERYAIEIEAEGDVGQLTNFEDPRQGWASQYCFVVD